ncbi:MAG TPA: LemA family protein [Gemmatimonadales bacterium]|jgi:LemA protein|nr:LemA family protein [Gemmatimonadales bacterium]
MRRSRFVALCLLGLATAGCGYNRLQTLDEQVNQAQSQIKVALQRRADLIGNLVATVQGIAHQEDTVFISVAKARSTLNGAVQSNDLQQMSAANAAMNAPLARLMAVAEAYPTLKSSDNFKQLQDQLEGTENRIATARTDYNTAVETFNASIRTFPTNLTAKMFGLSKARDYFDLTTPGAANAPVVKFN